MKFAKISSLFVFIIYTALGGMTFHADINLREKKSQEKSGYEIYFIDEDFKYAEPKLEDKRSGYNAEMLPDIQLYDKTDERRMPMPYIIRKRFIAQ